MLIGLLMWGYSIQSCMGGGYSIQSWKGEGSTPSSPGWGEAPHPVVDGALPSSLSGGTPCPDLRLGYLPSPSAGWVSPIQTWDGVPLSRLGMEYPLHMDLGWGTPWTWDGYPQPDLGWGTSHPDLGLGTPLSRCELIN